MLLGSFAAAVLVVALLTLALRALGLVGVSDITAARPQTDFIFRPDIWSFVVALVAGTVGALALSLGKTSAMVGVFISVTTVPAAGNLALGLALWVPTEITGSLSQLGLNLAGMYLAGDGVPHLPATLLGAPLRRRGAGLRGPALRPCHGRVRRLPG